jgi:pimeloyl-ACP methyl ester carboxylesterase
VNSKAVIAHGAASSADFVRRVFAEPLAAIGYDLVTWDRRTPVQEADAEFVALVRDNGATVVGGVSVGAILATRYALAEGDRLAGLLVALPPPQPVGVPLPTAGGSEGARHINVEEATRGAEPWVAGEIRAAWATYTQADLVRELSTASRAIPPAYDELAQCAVPTGLVALAGDPVHPMDAAEEWANAIPVAELETVQMHEPAANLTAIGHAAVRAWVRAQRVSESR